VPGGCRAILSLKPTSAWLLTQDHSGVAGRFTRRVGRKLEFISPQQVSRASGDTLTSSTQCQVQILSLDPGTLEYVRTGQDVFLGADSLK